MYRADIARLAADEGADEEQRGANEVTRTVIVRSEQLPRRTFKVFVV